MSIYGYVRVSTRTQVEHGQGLATQENAIEKYANENNLCLSSIFCDAGISGTRADRDGLTDLLSCLAPDDTVIVLNTSRLWRSDSVKVLIHHEFKKSKANIISIEQPTYSIYSKDPNDFLFNGMMELLDQYERMTISTKLAKGRKTKARNGSKACGTAPLGYKWHQNSIVIDIDDKNTVQTIYKAYKGTETLAGTSKELARLGITTKAGKAFSKQSIANILHNDFYIGIVTHAGKKSKGTHQPIIDNELFEEVNEMMER